MTPKQDEQEAISFAHFIGISKFTPVNYKKKLRWIKGTPEPISNESPYKKTEQLYELWKEKKNIGLAKK